MERFIRNLCSVIVSIIILSVTFTNVFAEGTEDTNAVKQNALTETETMNLVYQTGFVNGGWQEAVTTNEVAGTEDQSKGLSAFSLSIPATLGNVKYRVNLENVGWQDWVQNAENAGDTDSQNSIQAIQIEFTDQALENYDIYYHVNVDNAGWLDWAKNGEVAGAIDLGEDVNAIQVTFTEKDAPAPGDTTCASLEKDQLQNSNQIYYSTHVSNRGWQPTVSSGMISGTTGVSLAFEALKVESPVLSQFGDDSSIVYDLHCQNIGWTGETSDGSEAGTTGQSLRAEAAKIYLTGRAAAAYDIYYKVHSAFYDWLDWASNGAEAGTVGLSTPAEAIEIVLVPKNSPAPGSTQRPLISPDYLEERLAVEYNTLVSGRGWQNGFGNGEQAGTTGESLAVEALTVNLPNLTEGSSVNYQAHVAEIGWQEPVSNGNIAGTNDGKAIQAFTISLTGEDSYSYDIYYQAYCENTGWLGWAKNGEWAGTTGGGLRMEALRVQLVPRGYPAPGDTNNAYIDATPEPVDVGWYWPLDGITKLSSPFGPRWGRLHAGIDIPASTGTPIKAAKSGTVKICEYYYGYGNCVVIENDNTGELVYYAHQSAFNTSKGAHVNQGDIIGFVGSTGNSTGPHLHFGVSVNGSWINPMDLF